MTGLLVSSQITMPGRLPPLALNEGAISVSAIASEDGSSAGGSILSAAERSTLSLLLRAHFKEIIHDQPMYSNHLCGPSEYPFVVSGCK